jgi:methionyl aminopeptidase
MIRLKSAEQIKILAEGGKILSRILSDLAKAVKPGIFTDDLEKMARQLIKKAGGEPAFLGYRPHGEKPYPAALCASVNEAVVHTPATISYEIKNGDVAALDIGMFYKGLCTDMATTAIAGGVDKKIQKLVDITKFALEEAIGECKIGAPISDIGKKVEEIAKGAGFNIVKELVGHGVGFEVHEDPAVPNFFSRDAFDKIEEGLVIAIEPMIAAGSGKIEIAEDKWTFRTIDRSIAAHFEATVAVTKKGPVILTPIV